MNDFFNDQNQPEHMPPVPPLEMGALVRISAPVIPRADIVEIVRKTSNKEIANKKVGKRGRRPGQKNKPRAVVVKTATSVVKTAANSTKSIPRKQHAEDEQQLQAFEYYLGLGRNRSLPQVAEHFGLTQDTISAWSHRLAWVNRVRAIENRDVSQIIEDTGLQLILDKFKGMFILDPVDCKRMVIDPKASTGAIKDLVAAFVNLDKNSRERSEEGSGEGTGKGKNQVMVNVIIKK